jgi:hypothetical protein
MESSKDITLTNIQTEPNNQNITEYNPNKQLNNTTKKHREFIEFIEETKIIILELQLSKEN